MCGKCGAMDKNVAYFSYHEIEAVEQFESLGMKYDDLNVVTHRV